jgi:hypothetical protein
MSFDNNTYCYNSTDNLKVPITPGAYAFNISGSGDNVKMFPIYGCISSYGAFDFNDSTDGYLVMPGYFLKTYEDAYYGGDVDDYDNTNGSTVTFGHNGDTNLDSSCKLYYGSLANQLGDMIYAGLGPDNPVYVTVGDFNNFPYTITVANSTILPLFPGAYFFNLNLDSGDSNQNKVFPLYGCITNYGNFNISPFNPPVKQRYLVLPKFQLLTYNEPYTPDPPDPPVPPTSSIGPYVNYLGQSYMFGLSGDEDNDYSCTLGFTQNNPPNNSVLGLMNKVTNSPDPGWSAWSGFPGSYPGSFVNGPIYYTTPAGNIFPPTPFAWMFVQGGGDQTKAMPIYGSISSYGALSMNDTVDAYLVLPGFCVITFNDANWSGGSTIYNNISGSGYLYLTTDSNNDSSCLLFYKGVNNTTNLLGLMY